MAKPVAVDGDIKIETSTAKLLNDIDKTGSWSEGDLNVTLGKKISANGKKVVLSATMTWNYMGGQAHGVPTLTTQDSAELVAGETKLKDVGKNILVEADQATGKTDSGNKIFVKTEQDILTTA